MPNVDVALNSTDCTPAEMIAAAQMAEAAGFHTVWTYDHISGVALGGGRCLEVWTMLGALAGATKRVHLGPLVINVPLRHPAHIAQAAATLQELSGGRLVLGLGAGAGPESKFSDEQKMVGLRPFDAAQRRRRVEEAAGFIRALWRGDDQFDGVEYRFDTPVGIIRPAVVPPIVVGANGPKMAAVAGRVADAVSLHDWQATLPELIAITKAAADTANRPHPRIMVDGPCTAEWLDADSSVRRRLDRLSVDHVIARWSASLGLDILATCVG